MVSSQELGVEQYFKNFCVKVHGEVFSSEISHHRVLSHQLSWTNDTPNADDPVAVVCKGILD